MDLLSSPRERLQFVLPDFARHSWVSEAAQAIWQPRIERVGRAWLDIGWRSVVEEVRACGLLWLRPEMVSAIVPEWEAFRLSALRLNQGSDRAATPLSTSALDMMCIAVGSLQAITQLRDAMAKSDHDTVGRLLGYPPCCRAFFRKIWIEQRCIDTTWAMATNTTPPSDDRSIEIHLQGGCSQLANILWRWLGVRAVPHLPCRFDCPVTIAFGERLLQVGDQDGYSDEVQWIREMLSWPVEWSGLHGIAEIKTPILKIATRTDATAQKYIVRWTGTEFPKEGAIGIHFPYRRPSRPKFTESRGFRRGFHHITQAMAESPLQTWHHADNGFPSAEAMRHLHEPIVALARGALEGVKGNVLDLGCGNGMLLARICEGRSTLVPYGVDVSGLAVEHAHLILPHFTENVVRGDLFDLELWGSASRRYVLTLLMLGRLREVPKDKALRMLTRLRSISDRVLAYAYPYWGGQALEAIAGDFGLELQIPVSKSGGTAAGFAVEKENC